MKTTHLDRLIKHYRVTLRYIIAARFASAERLRILAQDGLDKGEKRIKRMRKALG